MSLEHRYLDIISGRSRSPLASLTRAALGIAEMPYRRLMNLRNARYDGDPARSHPLGRPTISVGNITAGGTGKTPVVQWLAKRLIAVGHRPAVLMRGYRKAGSGSSDEQVMLQELLPSIVVEANPDRIAGAASVLARFPETSTFVLDDGFQHRRAQRDFDLVLVHAGQPFGFCHVHPRGLLREPLSGLRRASAVLITHASEVAADALLKTKDELRRHSEAPIFHCDHTNLGIVPAPDAGTLSTLSDLATVPFLLVTGIGSPEPLVTAMRQFSGSFKGEVRFPDHHAYCPRDLARISKECRKKEAVIVLTTEKDWVKLQSLWVTAPNMPPAFRLQLSIQFWENEQDPLLTLIRRKLDRPPSSLTR